VPLFRRRPRPAPPPSTELPSGEEIERSVEATLIQGRSALRGALYMTNRRLLFEARAGDTRWMIVPWAEVKSAGLFPRPNMPMGPHRLGTRCLVVETTAGEHVWWDFGERDEAEWLPAVQQRAAAASADGTDIED
jgi:GRAM domain-containing protein